VFYGTRVMAADREGRETFSPAFTAHSGTFVSFWNAAQPLQLWSLQEEELALKFRQAPGSRLQLLNPEESPGHRTSQRACRRISAGKALPLSSLGICICSDQNTFLLDFHNSICCHIVNRSDCLCRMGDQWVGKLLQAPPPTRALLISLFKAQLIH